ncbi:MAG TPA: AAA family ATPase [Coriobacteriia bacterium]
MANSERSGRPASLSPCVAECSALSGQQSPDAVPMSRQQESGEALFALARDAAENRDFRLALRLYEAALNIENSAGRGTGPMLRRTLREMALIELRLGNPVIALMHARRLQLTAPDYAARRAGSRLVARAERALESAGSPGGAHTNSGDLHSIFQPEPLASSLTFADVGGMDAVKRHIYRAGILPSLDHETAALYGVTAGGAVLLYGPPGCGKTLIAQAAAGEMDAPLFVVTAADIMNPWLGMAERSLAAVFAAVRAHERSVLFFDELDAMAPVRGAMTVEGRRSVVNSLLTEIDGAKPNTGCLIIGATNAPELIDPALKRRGRFDKVICVGPPDRAAREAIFRVKLAGRPLADDVDPRDLAELSQGLTGADIDGAVRDAVEAVWSQSVAEGTHRDVHMLDVLMSLSRSRVDGKARNRIDELIAGRWRDALHNPT